MVLHKIEDGQKFINSFIDEKDAVALNWADELGTKTVAKMDTVSQYLTECLNTIQQLEDDITGSSNSFLTECGCSPLPNSSNNMLNSLLEEIKTLLIQITNCDSMTRDPISYGGEDRTEGTSSSSFNLGGAMPNGNSNEITQEKVKVKKR